MTQLNKKKFIVIKEKTNPTRVLKLKERATNLFDSNLEEVSLYSNSDYRPYWLNKESINSINDLMPSPPYTQLYANKYYCIGCKERQSFLVCKLCQLRTSKHFCKTSSTFKFTKKYNKVVVLGGMNGL